MEELETVLATIPTHEGDTAKSTYKISAKSRPYGETNAPFVAPHIGDDVYVDYSGSVSCDPYNFKIVDRLITNFHLPVDSDK